MLLSYHSNKTTVRLVNVLCRIFATVLGSCEHAANLPLFSYFVERMCACCYDRAWYAKYGGCNAIKYLMELVSDFLFIFQLVDSVLWKVNVEMCFVRLVSFFVEYFITL